MLRTPMGSWRTAYQGRFGAFGCATRFTTVERFAPPFVFSGKMNVRGRKYPYVTEWGTPITYDPGVVIMPMHDNAGTKWTGNEENVFFRFGSIGREDLGIPVQERVSVSAELPDEQGGYGVRTGYVKRQVGESPHPDGTGWHSFRVTVPSAREYMLEWDGELLAHVIEEEPATMFGPDFEISLRMDFLDVELKDLVVERAA